MKPAAGLIVVVASLLPGPGLAQPGEPSPAVSSERRLSAEQIEAVLAAAAKKREAIEQHRSPESRAEPLAPAAHGEVGVTIGTGGYREAFGTAVHPLGRDGSAAISFDYAGPGKRRDRR